ncbi:hypothetical protein ACHAPO_008355 [Fusarium lateritium]
MLTARDQDKVQKLMERPIYSVRLPTRKRESMTRRTTSDQEKIGKLMGESNEHVEMLAVPYWVTNHKIDEVAGEHFEEFNRVRQQFMRIFEEEEAKVDSDTPLSRVMQDTWNSKAFWFWHCLESVDAMIWLIWDQICPQFGTSWGPSMSTMLSKFWCQDSQEMVDKKMNELQVYDQELRDAFKKDRA